MPIIGTEHDLDQLTFTITGEFAAPIERVWQVYADPRQLERWWGPPTHPATVTEHSLEPGGRVRYYMTSPEGEKYHGLWEVVAVEPPRLLEFEDAFADADGNPQTDLPTGKGRVELTESGDGTRMVSTMTYASREALQQVLDMGMAEGATAAGNQIDALLAEDAA